MSRRGWYELLSGGGVTVFDGIEEPQFRAGNTATARKRDAEKQVLILMHFRWRPDRPKSEGGRNTR